MPAPSASSEVGAAPVIAYRADIDGLRAVAVLLVLVFHFQLLPLGKAGFIGVDMFFVISGFLITSIVLRQLAQGAFGLAGFYAARVRRLAPGLVIVLAVCAVYGWLRLLPLEFAELGRQLAFAQFYASNVYYWRNVNYFGLGAENVYLLHTWSLAVEEQFYLLYPLGLLAVHRWCRRWLWWLIGLAALASFALNVVIVSTKGMAAFYLLPTRAWQLLAGALLAGLAQGSLGRAAADAAGLTGAALIVVAIATHHGGVPVPGWYALLPVAAAVCLLVAGGSSNSVTSRALSLPPMVYVGRISYVLYLVHWPIHVFAKREFGADYGLAPRAAMFVLSLLAAAAICRWVEDPIRRRRWLEPDRVMVRAYLGALAASAAVCIAVVMSGGMPQRLPPEAARMEAFANDRAPLLNECTYQGTRQFPPPAPCRIGSATAAPRWLVFGDSHAWAAQPAFDEWLRRRGESGWLLSRHSCPPLQNVHLAGDIGDACFAFNRQLYAWLLADRQLDSVVLVSAWLQAAEGHLAERSGAGVDAQRSIAVFGRQLSASVEQLRRADKRVYLWAPVPGANASVPRELALAAWRGTPVELRFTRAEHERQFGFFYAALAPVRSQVDVLISPSAALCGDGMCRVVKDGQPLYFDNAHVAASPAGFWADVIEASERASAK